jgi:uncharacterized protein
VTDRRSQVAGGIILRLVTDCKIDMLYIMVDDVASTLDLVIANSGEIVQPIGGDAPEITARFRYPAGNILGLFSGFDRIQAFRKNNPATSGNARVRA